MLVSILQLMPPRGNLHVNVWVASEDPAPAKVEDENSAGKHFGKKCKHEHLGAGVNIASSYKRKSADCEKHLEYVAPPGARHAGNGD